MTSPARITIFDTTLRDGEQAPGFSMREAEKVRLARKLDSLGVDVMEAGFPIASEDDFNSVRAVAREVRRPIVAALARSVDADIDRAAQALEGAARPRIHTFIATSDLHLEHKLRMSRAECLDQAAGAIRRARRYVNDVEFSAEDATRSDLEFPRRRRRGRHRGGRDDREPPGHGRVRDARRDRPVLPDRSRARPGIGPRRLLGALSQRPRTCRREQPRRASRADAASSSAP